MMDFHHPPADLDAMYNRYDEIGEDAAAHGMTRTLEPGSSIRSSDTPSRSVNMTNAGDVPSIGCVSTDIAVVRFAAISEYTDAMEVWFNSVSTHVGQRLFNAADYGGTSLG